MMSTPAVEAQIRINATPDSVYHALIDEAALRDWFAEDVRVDVEQGIYEFSGRYTPGMPEPGASRMALLRAEAGQWLNYTWWIDGSETAVMIRLQPDDNATDLTLRHCKLPREVAWLYECFWSMALENLRGYVERGEPGIRFDFSAVPAGDVELSAEIDADPEAVFQALIDPGQLDRYMSHDPANVEPRVGGAYSVGWGDEGPVKILDLVPGRRLSYSWKARNPDVGDTVVTWEIKGSDGRTRLSLVHSGFAPDRNGLDFGIGWLDFINRIKQMVEVGGSWRKPAIDIVEDRGIRDEGLYPQPAGIHEAVATAPARTTGQHGR